MFVLLLILTLITVVLRMDKKMEVKHRHVGNINDSEHMESALES